MFKFLKLKKSMYPDYIPPIPLYEFCIINATIKSGTASEYWNIKLSWFTRLIWLKNTKRIDITSVIKMITSKNLSYGFKNIIAVRTVVLFKLNLIGCWLLIISFFINILTCKYVCGLFYGMTSRCIYP